MNPRIKIAIQWGVIGGLGMCIFRFLIYLISPMSVSNWDNAYFVPLLFCMIWGVITAKRTNGGYLTFGEAFVVTFLTAMIGVIINTAFAFLLIKVIDPDLETKLFAKAMEAAQERWEKAGLSDDQMEKAREQAQKFMQTKFLLPIVLVSQTLIGAIISLIISAFAKRPDDRLPQAPIENQNQPS